MEKEKQEYKKIVKYKRKPKWDDILGGSLFLITSFAILILYFKKNAPVTLLIFLMTLMIVFGFKSIIKGMGQERKIYYIKK